jgi:hypothetical protein
MWPTWPRWSRQRWQVETALAQLTTTLPIDVVHGQTVPSGVQELTSVAIVDNLVRLVMGPSARLQHIGVARMSCLDALRWLGAPSARTP